MGYDAACTIRIDGETARGTAWLEHKDLLFRGPFRLVIPLADIATATAKDGCLLVRFGKRVAELEIGAAAEKWANRITNPPSRLDKLGVKPSMTVMLVGVRDDDFEGELRARGATLVKRAAAAAPPDLIFFAVEQRESLDRLASLAAMIQRNGAVWVLRPKGKSGISEADTMAAGKRAGLVDVKVVSFSDAITRREIRHPGGETRGASASFVSLTTWTRIALFTGASLTAHVCHERPAEPPAKTSSPCPRHLAYHRRGRVVGRGLASGTAGLLSGMGTKKRIAGATARHSGWSRTHPVGTYERYQRSSLERSC